MSETIFRKKSMDAISSPEQLTDYIRVANPGLWMGLAAVVIFLVAVCVWGVFGRLDTTLDVAAISDGSSTVCYVREDDIDSVKVGMPVALGDAQYSVTGIPAQPVSVDGGFEEYALHVGGLKTGEWVYAVAVDGELPKGVYAAKLVIDSVAPKVFVLN